MTLILWIAGVLLGLFLLLWVKAIRAGILRNQAMLDQHPTISLVIAFPVQGSRGTKDMMSRAMLAGIDLHVYTGHGCSA